MTASPELETPERQGSRALGILGALLGAFCGALFTDLLLLVLPDEVGKLATLGNMVLVGWTACRGYRLLKGYRSMRFAQWTVRISIVLGQLLGLAVIVALAGLWQIGETWRYALEIFAWAFAKMVKLLLSREGLPFLMMVLASLLFVNWNGLLKYVDPDWYSDPRRLAQIGGGGATSNLVPCWPLPPNENIPERFEVDKGTLIVENDIITVREKRKVPRSFSVKEVAGVVMGTPSGYNILYDTENRMLARFAWSANNALLFGQYLVKNQIPFMDPNGEKVQTKLRQEEIRSRFVVREPKWYLGVICFLLLLSCGAAVFFRLLLGSDPLVYLLMGFFLLLGVPYGLYGLLQYKNWRLEVDGTQVLYRTAFGKETKFCLDEVREVKFRPILGAWELRDREGKRLARVDQFMENAGLMSAYLEEYQTQRKD